MEDSRWFWRESIGGGYKNAILGRFVCAGSETWVVFASEKVFFFFFFFLSWVQ